MRAWLVIVCCMISLGWAEQSQAQSPTIYGNSASGGNNPIHIIDGTTGVETTRYIGQAHGNGRGIVVVGNTIYYTVVGDPRIYTMDKATGVTTGSILTQNQSMSTIAWDGSTFWTTDYSGTKNAYQIDPATGNNIKTITLSLAENRAYMDGMEYFDGKLIANRFDGGWGGTNIYDVYDLNGNVLQAGLIQSVNGTGIAFDGTNFLVSDVRGSKIGVYDGTTGAFLRDINLTSAFGSFLIEDLSVDYSKRKDTGGQVPAPGALVLGGLGMSLVGWLRRRRMV